MRAAPAFQISLDRFGVWRAGIFCLTSLGILSMALWLAGRERVLWIDGLTLVAAIPLLFLARSLARVPAVDLRWDGQVWGLRAQGQPVDLEKAGHLQVVIDLGPWMLLRFIADEPRMRPTWLPVQALGIRPHWHALRCAVHAPRRRPAVETAAE
jgi:hypothetical protein